MKKYLALLLVLLPLMVGCMNQEPEQSHSTTLPLTTLPPAYYDENSGLEIATDGAVKQYTLPGSGYNGIYRVGNGVLLTTDAEISELRMLTGETCIPSVSVELNQSCLGQCVALTNGFAYYDVESHSVQYLDSNLSQRHSVVMTDEMTSPLISPDGSTIYYCFGNEIRAMDVEKNISRLVKTHNFAKQILLDTCFEGSVLICKTEDDNGNSGTLYISTKDGKTISDGNGISQLFTSENEYLALWVDGVVEQWVCGTKEETARKFVAEDEYFVDAMDVGGVLGYSVEGKNLLLNFYTMPTAEKTASLVLENAGKPDVLFADNWAQCIWMILNNPQGQGKVLLKWDLQKTKCSDADVYTTVLYTAENPDQDGLDELQKRVEELNSKHGVRIRIWQEAVEKPSGHILVPEYQTVAISDMLDELEAVLNEFPKKFVYKSISSRVRICLIRSIDGESEGQQYWDGRYAFITLCSGSNLREDFLKGFGIVIDSHVLGNSPVYDYWDTLNPAGFVYGKPDESHVTGEQRYFVDIDSMTSSMVDRSRVFWQAMLPDNAELFQSEFMQKKLTMLCKAIRDAWNLEKKTDVYPWEQYLEKSIVPKK